MKLAHCCHPQEPWSKSPQFSKTELVIFWMSKEHVSLIFLKMIVVKGYSPGLHLESCINEVLRKTCQFGSINEVVQSFQVSSDKIQVPKKEKRIFYEFCAGSGAVIQQD